MVTLLDYINGIVPGFAWVILFLVALGAFKFIKDWLPW